jgi:hypothetical protein
VLRQTGNAFIGLAHPSTTFETEGFGDDANGEGAALLRDLRDHGSSTGTGATAHAGGDEHQIGTLKSLLKISPGFLGRLLADAGIATGTKATGQRLSKLNPVVC